MTIKPTTSPQSQKNSKTTATSQRVSNNDSVGDSSSRIIPPTQQKQKEACPQQQQQQRWTSLHGEVSNNNVSRVESLLTSGVVDPNETDREGRKPIFYSCENCYQSPDITISLLKHGSTMCDHMDWNAKEQVLNLAFQKLHPKKDEDILLRLINDCMDEINEMSIKRNAVVTAILFLYLKISLIICFVYIVIAQSQSLVPRFFLYFLSAFGLLAEAIEFHTLVDDGAEVLYLKDPWKWMHLTTYVLVIVSTTISLSSSSSDGEGNNNNIHYQNVFITTVAFLCLSFLGDLKTTFLPFSIFVSGVARIFYELLPFLTVTFIVLLSFSLMYYIQGPSVYSSPDEEPSFQDAFFYVFAGFAGGLDGVYSYLDVVFGLVLVIVLFNVVIAIVSSSWQTAVNDSFISFVKNRVELLRTARIDYKVEEKYPCMKGICLASWLDQEFWIDRFDDRWTSWEKAYSGSRNNVTSSSKTICKFSLYILKVICLFIWGALGVLSIGILWPTRIRRHLFEIQRGRDTVGMGVDHVAKETESISSEVANLHVKLNQQNARIERLESRLNGMSDKLDLILDRLVGPTSAPKLESYVSPPPEGAGTEPEHIQKKVS